MIFYHVGPGDHSGHQACPLSHPAKPRKEVSYCIVLEAGSSGLSSSIREGIPAISQCGRMHHDRSNCKTKKLLDKNLTRFREVPGFLKTVYSSGS